MKGNKKALIYLLAFVAIFALFIFILLRPSTQSKAIKEINTCANTEDVKATWYKYRLDLADDNDFCQVVRDKLTSFNLKQTEITEIKKWLPSKTKNLNVIVVPDLSLRIKDYSNNPDQIKNDTALLNKIWSSFKDNVRLKMNTKDRLLIDVADPSQAQEQFKSLADNLLFDLSDHKNKTNRLYFTNDIQAKFSTNISRLYDLASQQTSGANYVYYFSEKLPTRIKKSTLDDDYRNILLILTDGYLEIGKGISISPTPAMLKQYCSSGVLNYSLPTQTIDAAYPNLEAYIFEVNERQNGKGCDFRGLKKWWTEWFKSMNVSNVNEDFFFRRQDAISLTQKQIETIFSH
jgi:hypothetical protein